MNKIGIRFTIPNKHGQFLKVILAELNLKDYFWNIDDDEIFLTNNSYLFQENIYSNDDFLKIVSAQDYYLVHACLQAWRTNQVTEINNYLDFKNSKCEILILIVDCEDIDIYAKNSSIISTIKRTALKNKFTNIEDIYDDNNPRNIFTLKK